MAKQEYICHVTRFNWLTPSVFELHFKPHSELTFLAGQFVSIIIPGKGPNGRDLRRAYSIASAPQDENIELCVKLVENGPGTNYLKSLGDQPNAEFKCVAPYGTFILKTEKDRIPYFIATGTGIAPFRSMIKETSFFDNFKNSHCTLGVREEEELLYTDELRNYSKLTYNACVSRPKKTLDPTFQHKGRVTDFLKDQLPTLPIDKMDFYLCGNGAMITEIKSILQNANVQKENIHQEVYYK